MKVIWKFKLEASSKEFDAPAGARCVKAVIDPTGQPCLYLLCEREAPKAKHAVTLFATAQSIGEDAGDYVDTLAFEVEGRPPIVMHIFHKQLGIKLSS